MRRSFWKPFVLSWALCLVGLCNADETDLENRVAHLERALAEMELRLETRSIEDWFNAKDGSVGMPKPRTKDEFEATLHLDSTGEARRRDRAAEFPEISTFVAWSNGRRNIVNGLGVELFHKRDRPRRHSWMFKLMLADEWVGFSAGYIVVPVINFNIGPFIAKDLDELPGRPKETVFGIQASVFSF